MLPFSSTIPEALTRSPADLQRHARQRSARGFTLIELMVVVVIVAILATISVPAVVERFRERRSQEAAERIAALYRSARMRALGRGAAILVRYDAGVFRLFEAVRPAADSNDCANLPSSSCLATSWADPDQRRELSVLDLPARGEYSGVSVTLGEGGTQRDVCYTPLGRAYTRSTVTDGTPWNPLAGVLTATVRRSSAGLPRIITVLPNGITRVVARPAS